MISYRSLYRDFMELFKNSTSSSLAYNSKKIDSLYLYKYCLALIQMLARNCTSIILRLYKCKHSLAGVFAYTCGSKSAMLLLKTEKHLQKNAQCNIE